MLIDITKVFKKYKGQWVAFKEDEKTVISSGKTAKEAYEKALSKGYKNPILSRMPTELVNYIG
jgi:hypothetical protein